MADYLSERQTMLQHMMVATLLMFIYKTVSGLIQASKKGKAGLRAPEDGGPAPLVQGGDSEAAEDAQRWNRIIMNDLENITFALIVFWGATLVFLLYPHTWERSQSNAHETLLWIWVGSRIAFTVCYAYGLQPWRSIVFLAGTFSVIGVAINALVLVFRKQWSVLP